MQGEFKKCRISDFGLRNVGFGIKEKSRKNAYQNSEIKNPKSAIPLSQFLKKTIDFPCC